MTKRGRAVARCLAAAALLAVILWTGPGAVGANPATPAASSGACAGLTAFGAALSAAHDAYLSQRSHDGVPVDSDPRDFSPVEWERLAADLKAYRSAAAAIAAPDWLAAWQASLLAELDAEAQFATASASRGIPYAQALWGSTLAKSREALDGATAEAVSTCADFASVAFEITGWSGSLATPAATPIG